MLAERIVPNARSVDSGCEPVGGDDGNDSVQPNEALLSLGFRHPSGQVRIVAFSEYIVRMVIKIGRWTPWVWVALDRGGRYKNHGPAK